MSFAKLSAKVWARNEDHAIGMKDYYLEVSRMREEVEIRLDEQAIDVKEVECDNVSEASHGKSDDDGHDMRSAAGSKSHVGSSDAGRTPKRRFTAWSAVVTRICLFSLKKQPKELFVLAHTLISNREGDTRSCDLWSPQILNQEDIHTWQGYNALLGHPSRLPSRHSLRTLSTTFTHHLSCFRQDTPIFWDV